MQGELEGRKGRSQIGQRWIAGWLKADLAMRIDQGGFAESSKCDRMKMVDLGGFAEGSRCDRAKRELPAGDRAKAIDQGEMAE